MTSTRAKLLDELRQLSELTPDVRFGQLIANSSFLAIGNRVESTWDVEDEELLEAIRKQIGDFSQRNAEAA